MLPDADIADARARIVDVVAAEVPLRRVGREFVGRCPFHNDRNPQDELVRRQVALNSHFNRSPADFKLEMSLDAREGKEALLVEYHRYSDEPKFTPLWHQVWNFVREEDIKVVGIDTAAVVFGGNENFRSQVTNFMREIVKRAVMINGAVVLTVHPPKGNESSYSGTSA